MKKKDPAQAVFDLLAFQYQPLIDGLKKHLPAKDFNKFNKKSPADKIRILDNLANRLGF